MQCCQNLTDDHACLTGLIRNQELWSTLKNVLETSCSVTLSLTYLVTLIKRSPMLVLVCHIETLFTYQVLVVFVFLLFERCNLQIDSYASLWGQHDVDDPWVVSKDLSAEKTDV